MPDPLLAVLVKSTVMSMFFLVMSVLWILTVLISFFKHPLKWSQLSVIHRSALILMVLSPVLTIVAIPLMWLLYYLSYETIAWLSSFLSVFSLAALGGVTVYVIVEDTKQKQLF
eukprot:TRINITY_DN22666_c0_g1_i1.p2 TRINITY_DN22666_c0_g1~~TRINITY_DN22666_c0_g1_i1.p2  ORF type:complete len:114 (-),score=25.00 TRINITY_DN22666_c0_g1_i1:302-643(-)